MTGRIAVAKARTALLALKPSGASGGQALEDEEAVRTAVQRWQENRSADN
ncbi:hypothetical protein GCM10009727_53000 [Actinomadura napierensis]|uniref:Uncharacterized protein n=2 Tax=Actinomadura napierensis TaxID=267854 RepID=A0ABN2ZXC1_9ACTN